MKKRLVALVFVVAVAIALVAGFIRSVHAPTARPSVSLEIVLVDDELDPFAALEDAVLLAGMTRYREKVARGAPTYVVYQPTPSTPFSDALRTADDWVKKHLRLRPGMRIAWEREDGSAPTLFTLHSYVLRGLPFVEPKDVREVEVQPPRPAHEIELLVLLDDEAERRMSEVTRLHVGSRFAILIDGVVHSAPTVTAQIPGGSALIKLGPESKPGRARAETLALALRGELERSP